MAAGHDLPPRAARAALAGGVWRAAGAAWAGAQPPSARARQIV
jgi:hypothetical protein